MAVLVRLMKFGRITNVVRKRKRQQGQKGILCHVRVDSNSDVRSYLVTMATAATLKTRKAKNVTQTLRVFTCEFDSRMD